MPSALLAGSRGPGLPGRDPHRLPLPRATSSEPQGLRMVQFFRSDQSPDPQCPAHGPPAPGWPGWCLALPKVCRSGRACAAAACQASVSPGVYAFGFLFMLPQLFVNYKVWCCPVWVVWGLLGCLACQQDVCACPQMKSVAHLPWKAFTYKVSALRWGPRWAHPQGYGAGAVSSAEEPWRRRQDATALQL